MINQLKTALILSAGRGERLKPLTNTKPKPLFLIGNKPLIIYHIEHLATAGIKMLVINHAYLGGQIKRFLGNGNSWGVNIEYSPEPPGGLETGGGIVNALALLKEDDFIVVNADIYTNFSFSTLNQSRLAPVHLVLTYQENMPKDFGLNQDGTVSNLSKRYTFTGIAVYKKNILTDLPIGRYSITPLLRQLADSNQVSGELLPVSKYWIDTGTLERLRAAQRLF